MSEKLKGFRDYIKDAIEEREAVSRRYAENAENAIRALTISSCARAAQIGKAKQEKLARGADVGAENRTLLVEAATLESATVRIRMEYAAACARQLERIDTYIAFVRELAGPGKDAEDYRDLLEKTPWAGEKEMTA